MVEDRKRSATGSDGDEADLWNWRATVNLLALAARVERKSFIHVVSKVMGANLDHILV
jgi:hypothetical protein